MSWAQSLSDLSLYRRQVDRLAARLRGRTAFRHDPEAEEFIRLAAADAPRLARLLRDEVMAGTWQGTPTAFHDAFLAGKVRRLVKLSPFDQVVHAVLAETLAARIRPQLGSELYSYLPGRSAHGALRALGNFLRHHRASRPDPRTRAVWVFRSDIRAYTDSISLQAEGPLGRAMAAMLQNEAPWLEKTMRAALLPAGTGTSGPERGLATGSPLVPVIANFFLLPLDRCLSAQGDPSRYYGRFGDDFLYADTKQDRFLEQVARITPLLAERDLEMNPKKIRAVYFTGSGGPATPCALPGLTGSHQIDWLGYRIDFRGRLSLPPTKTQAFLRSLRQRTRSLRQSSPPALAATTVARGLRVALTPGNAAAESLTPELLHEVDDRSYLRDLDYRVALGVAQSLVRSRGAKAFRTLSYRSLRDLGLPSLVWERNRPRIKDSR